MITRVIRGCNPVDLMAYLYGPGRFNEHTGQRLVACWERGNETQLEPAGFAAHTMTDGELRGHGRAVGRVLDLPVGACDTEPAYVYHLILRNHASDPVLSDSQWAAIARDCMDRTGIAPDGDPMGCRWAVVRHADDHVHLVATLARQDGLKPRLRRDFLRLREVAHDWEARLGLRRSADADRTAAVRPTIGETKKAERVAAQAASAESSRAGRQRWAGAHSAAAGGPRTARAPETPRQQLARLVHAGAAQASDLSSLRSVLQGAGVEVFVRESTIRPGEVTGLSFGLHGHADADGQLIRYGGAKLAPDLSWPKLAARWAVAPTDAPTEAGPGGDQEQVGATWREAAWREAEQIVRDAAADLQDHGVSDPAAASDAVWAASDTVRSLAWGLEGKRLGPLHRAADDLARAGRQSYRRTPVRSSRGAALRRASWLVAQVASRTGSRDLQAQALILALGGLARAVAATREAEGRAQQAQAARMSADQLAEVASARQPGGVWAARPAVARRGPTTGNPPEPWPATAPGEARRRGGEPGHGR